MTVSLCIRQWSKRNDDWVRVEELDWSAESQVLTSGVTLNADIEPKTHHQTPITFTQLLGWPNTFGNIVYIPVCIKFYTNKYDAAQLLNTDDNNNVIIWQQAPNQHVKMIQCKIKCYNVFWSNQFWVSRLLSKTFYQCQFFLCVFVMQPILDFWLMFSICDPQGPVRMTGETPLVRTEERCL